MLTEIKNELIEKCYQTVINQPSQKMKTVVDKLKAATSTEDFEKGIRSIVEFTIAQSILMKMNEEDIEDVLIKSIKEFMIQLPTLKKSYIFSVELKGFEKEVRRTLEVPA